MRRYRRNPHAAARVIEGMAFVVTPADSKLHTLNSAATRLWDLAGRGAVSVDDAASELMAVYEVDAPRASQDAMACLEELVVRGILLADEGGADDAPPRSPASEP